MDEYIEIYLYDIKRAIDEMESYFDGYPMRDCQIQELSLIPGIE